MHDKDLSSLSDEELLDYIDQNDPDGLYSDLGVPSDRPLNRGEIDMARSRGREKTDHGAFHGSDLPAYHREVDRRGLRFHESVTFDKFMDNILVKEKKSRDKNVLKEETPQRKYIERYTERAANRIRIKR